MEGLIFLLYWHRLQICASAGSSVSRYFRGRASLTFTFQNRDEKTNRNKENEFANHSKHNYLSIIYLLGVVQKWQIKNQPPVKTSDYLDIFHIHLLLWAVGLSTICFSLHILILVNSCDNKGIDAIQNTCNT